jgi:hypothetical protein
MHKAGITWAEIGDLVGQRSRLVTADTYSHVLLDSREVDRGALLAMSDELRPARRVLSPVLSSSLS